MVIWRDCLLKIVCLAVCFLFPVAGFAADPGPQKEIAVRNIAVMPFLPGSREAKKERHLEKTLDCQLAGLCNIEDLQSGAEEAMTALYQKELTKMLGDKVVSAMVVKTAYSRLEKNDNRTPRDLAIELGKTLMVDHVLVGLLSRYQQRDGSSRSVASPASVAFSVFLVNVQTGKLVWQSAFNKTQTALSENLFDAPLFFKQGMKWLTVEELASYGAQKGLKGLVVSK